MWIKYVTSSLFLASVIFYFPSSFSDEVGPIYDYEYRNPFLVSVQLEGFHQCTGTIIAPTWILTAAFCARSPAHKMNIVYGVPNIHFNSKYGDNVVQIKAQYFPKNVIGSRESHIALIQLQEPLTYNKYVAPVVLPEEDTDLAGDFTELVGWMYLYNMTHYTYGAQPQAIELIVESNEECADRLGSIWNSSVNICTTYDHANKLYPCMAYGAPLMYDNIQVGIDAQLPGTQICDLPSFYVKVSYYTKWIASVIDQFENK